MYDDRIDAPADEPPTTPPRSSTFSTSRCVRVCRYESARCHWRPPTNQTAFAVVSGFTNSSESATLRSSVCSTVMCVTPKSLNIFRPGDRKSTRLNSSHSQISYAVFCLKKKKVHAKDTYFSTRR